MRKLAVFVSLVLLVVAIAAPASATKPGTDPELEDGHKIWICHATRSLSNPYVKILIDIAAWDVDDPDSNDHGPDHHAREKQGVMWADYALNHPDDECEIDPPATCEFAHYVVTFPGTKLIRNSTERLTVSATIPAGTYEVVLVSSDVGRGGSPEVPLVQDNEQWLLRGGEFGAYIGTPSGYTKDLVDTYDDIFDQETLSTISFPVEVMKLTAEHWNVEMTSKSPDSVVPQAACLTLVDEPED